MASTLLITIKSGRTSTDIVDRLVKDSSARKEELLVLAHYFDSVAAGIESADVDVQYDASAPVSASGTFTLDTVVATDAITIGTTTFTFTSTPSASTDVEVDGSDDDADATALAAAINAHTTVNKIVTASAAGAVVTITAKQKGVVGNFIPISSADTTIVASGTFLEDGAGGATSESVSYDGGL